MGVEQLLYVYVLLIAAKYSCECCGDTESVGGAVGPCAVYPERNPHGRHQDREPQPQDRGKATRRICSSVIMMH